MDAHVMMIERAIALLVRAGKASAGMLQRKLRIGHRRARMLLTELRWLGVVGPRRRVLLTSRDWNQILAG